MTLFIICSIFILVFLIYYLLKKDPDPFIYIAHAGGRYNGNTYLNNLKAIEHNRKRGYKYFELDIIHYGGEIIVTHDTNRMTPDSPRIDDIIEYNKEHKLNFILDIKNDYYIVIDKLPKNPYFIIQVYCMEDLESLSIFKKIIIANWKYSPSEKEIRKMVQYAKKNNITIVGTSLWSKFTDHYKNCEDKYALYKELGIPIFIHGKIKTIDDIKYAKNSSSINGIFNLTDYII